MLIVYVKLSLGVVVVVESSRSRTYHVARRNCG